MIIKIELILILIILSILFLPVVSAEIVTAKVDDKGLIVDYHGRIIGTLHTCYGEISVSDTDYNQININDTIRYDTNMIDSFWTHYWDVEKLN